MTDRLPGPGNSGDSHDEEPEDEAEVVSQWRYRVQLAVDLLKAAKVADVVSYASLATALGLSDEADRDIIQSIVYAARKLVRREPGFVFRPVENQGFQRLSDAEIADHVGEESRHRLRGLTRRTAEELECVKEFSALTPEQRMKWNTSYAVNGIVAHALTAKSVAKVLTGVSSVEQQMLATQQLLGSL